jgi:hypothetical protein
MRYFVLALFVVIIKNSFGQEKFQLAPPMLKYQSAFFSGHTSFEITFNQPDAEVRYTLNGRDPLETDMLYSKPVTITARTLVKARAFGKDFLPSEIVTATFVKDGKLIRSASFSKPNESYASCKPEMLIDNTGGIVNYRSGTWVGFDSDTVFVDIELNREETVDNVLVNLLQDENSWIFMPKQLTVYYWNPAKKAYVSTAEQKFTHDQPGAKTCRVVEIKPGSAITTNKLLLVFLTVKKIPDWHPGKGQHGWLFIDEIKVY